MTVPIIAAKKGGDALNKALTGDLYVRRWTSTKGTGKKKREIEHEAHVNPLVLGFAAVAAGVTAVGAGVALWMMQRKVDVNDYHYIYLIVDQMDTTYKEVQVVVTEAYTYDRLVWHEPVYYTEKIPIAYDDEGNPIAWKTVETLVTEGYTTTVTETVPAVYETRTVVDKPGYYIVKNGRGIPYMRKEGVAFEGNLTTPANVLTQKQSSLNYTFNGIMHPEVAIKGGVRKWWRFISTDKKSVSLGEREGFQLAPSIDIM